MTGSAHLDYFDTHCHLNFKRFKNSLASTIERARATGVSRIVIPGTDVKTSREAVRIATEYEHIFAAVGIHPHHVFHYLKLSPHPAASSHEREVFRTERMVEDIQEIASLLGASGVVAMGEVGLDRHEYTDTVYADYAVHEGFFLIQETVFRKQIELAIRHQTSLIIHNREATDDVLRVLSEMWDTRLAGRTVFHCAEPDKKILAFAKERDIYLGVDGDITYDAGKREFYRDVPLEMIVVETDSPYLLPEPLRSARQFPNEPAHVSIVVQHLAAILNEEVAVVARETYAHGCKLFAI